MKQLDYISLTEQLSEVISEVISVYECAVIPGFGGFVSHYQPARFESTSHLIQPPSRSVSFNALLHQNDGLLAQALAKKIAMPYKEALAMINDLVAEWQDELEEGKAVDFNGWGTFAKTKEGKIVFASSLKKNLLSASYGLKSVKAELVQKDGISGKLKEEYVNRQASPVFNQKVRRGLVTMGAAAAVVLLCFWTVFNYDLVQEKSASLSLNFFSSDEPADESAAQLAAESAVDGGVETGGKPIVTIKNEKTGIQNEKEENTGMGVSTESSEITIADDDQAIPGGLDSIRGSFDLVQGQQSDNAIEKHEELSDQKSIPEIEFDDSADNPATDASKLSERQLEKIDNTAVEIEKEQNKGLQKPYTVGRYVIIAGCFQSMSNAKNFVKELNDLGYPAHLNGASPTGLYRVAYGTFDNRVQALKKLASIRLNHSAQAWMTRR